MGLEGTHHLLQKEGLGVTLPIVCVFIIIKPQLFLTTFNMHSNYVTSPR